MARSAIARRGEKPGREGCKRRRCPNLHKPRLELNLFGRAINRLSGLIDAPGLVYSEHLSLRSIHSNAPPDQSLVLVCTHWAVASTLLPDKSSRHAPALFTSTPCCDCAGNGSLSMVCIAIAEPALVLWHPPSPLSTLFGQACSQHALASSHNIHVVPASKTLRAVATSQERTQWQWQNLQQATLECNLFITLLHILLQPGLPHKSTYVRSRGI